MWATKYDVHRILMKASELADALANITTGVNGVSDQLTKATKEITNEIANLQNAVTNVDLPEAATTALTNLQAAVGKLTPLSQALDDLNPDQPTTPPTP